MEPSQIDAALAEIARPYADRRVNIFDVTTAGFEGNTLFLQGRVLEEAQLRALQAGLEQRLPGLQLDLREVAVARTAATRRMVVSTNLTSVHDGTSFLAEQVTQMLNGVPVDVLWEQDRWGFVRQPDGYLGWTYLPYLSEGQAPETTHLVISPVTPLREGQNTKTVILNRVLGGTFVRVEETGAEWSRLVLAGGGQGWIPTGHLRALSDLPQDPAARRAQLAHDALNMIGVPYLWGGCSANGIDCSGYAQLLHRWIGITIPRDADMQFSAGKQVEPSFEAGTLLFFGEQGEKRRITHVGISLGGWQIIHSSRSRNGVQVDDVQAVPHLRDSFLCAATYIG